MDTRKLRKIYTLTKKRESWTEDEHQSFLQAIRVYGREWTKVALYVRTKTTQQIRSHAQKVFERWRAEGKEALIPPQLKVTHPPSNKPFLEPSHPAPKIEPFLQLSPRFESEPEPAPEPKPEPEPCAVVPLSSLEHDSNLCMQFYAQTLYLMLPSPCCMTKFQDTPIKYSESDDSMLIAQPEGNLL